MNGRHVVIHSRVETWIALLLFAITGPARAWQVSSIDRERGVLMLHGVRKDLEQRYYDSTFHGLNLAALFDSYRAYTASPLSGIWDRVGRLFGVRPIESPAGLDAAAGFTGLEVAREHKGGLAYLLFDVDCDWEPEHGMMVVFHQDRPATWTTVDALELESDTFEQ